MTHADQIREYVLKTYIIPARQSGNSMATVHAKEIHAALGFGNRMPLVCGALDADKFLDYAQVTLVRRTGPKQGSTAEWVFEIK
jgi:hypothetical protein